MELSLIDKLISCARVAQEKAYAPYSKFMVGAAVLTRGDNVYGGCNVESADYDGTHAEEAALCAMVMGGERSPIMVVAIGALEGKEPVIIQPCGKCRQKLQEFASLSGLDLCVAHYMNPDFTVSARPLSRLLEDTFGPADVGIDLAKYRR